jgi:diguanylate cyclase (GGDEF)-like protein
MKTAPLLAAMALVFTAHATTPPAASQLVAYVRNPLEEQVDTLVRDGFENPQQALAGLEKLRQANTATPTTQRVLLQAIGSVQAQSGATAQAIAIAVELALLAPADASGRTLAASKLVRANAALRLGQLDLVAELAQSALSVFQAHCPGDTTRRDMSDAAACDYRSAWRALELLERRASGQGLEVAATAHAQVALVLAEWARDSYRQIDNLSSLAWNAQGRGESALAQGLIGQAIRLVGQTGDLRQQARVRSTEAQLANLQGNLSLALQKLEQARTLTQQAKAPRLESRILNNLSDLYAQLGRHADALRTAEQALPLAQHNQDRALVGTLLSNMAVATIRLGRIGEGKQLLARSLDIWREGGETGPQVTTLIEVGEALAAAGDARGALDLYHSERKLSEELARANRSLAIEKLQARNQAGARQRDIELLERDNALKTEALANNELQQRIWWLLAVVMLLATALITVFYRRVRDTNQRLAASQVQLQVQSERDPLTNLANRRHFQSVMARLESQPGGFEGALLMLDIDHFKKVNDVYGHAAGDQVLVELAQRLNGALRSDDLVVRWGGEEFLVLAPRATTEQADYMAARVLHGIGGTPMDLGTAVLQVTASIGYARFPLAPNCTHMPWAQAIKLVDLALYSAKEQGRNQAMGITASTAATAEALQVIEEDFENAWHSGQVTLLQTPGPSAEES